MAEHTPGPWFQSSPHSSEIRGENGRKLVAEFWTRPTAEDERLMLAAPDLLAALREAQSVLAILIDPGSQHVSSVHVFAQATAAEAKARAAIAKAEERS